MLHLDSQLITVGRLFRALDEIATKHYAPKTLPPPPITVMCWELKRVITEQFTREYKEANGEPPRET